MAKGKKSFKSLPKKAQRAAFAQMDDDGTRKRGAKKASSSGIKPKSKVLKATHPGFRVSEGIAPGTVRVQSPKLQVGLSPRAGRTDNQIIKDMKKLFNKK